MNDYAHADSPARKTTGGDLVEGPGRVGCAK